MNKLVIAVALATLIPSAGAWLGPLLLIAMVVIAGVAIGFLVRRIGGTRQRERELDLIRREMLDECFAKGEMFREDCEGRCKGLVHARETTHPPSSAPTAGEDVF